MSAIASSTNANLYNLTTYGRAYLITCTNSSKCGFFGTAYLTIANDADGVPVVAYWNHSVAGWIVKARDYAYAKAFVDELNAADTLVTLGESEVTDEAYEADEAEVNMEEDDDIYTIARYGRAYLIECNDPT